MCKVQPFSRLIESVTKTNNAIKQTIKNINKQLAKNVQHSLQTKNMCNLKHKFDLNKLIQAATNYKDQSYRLVQTNMSNVVKLK